MNQMVQRLGEIMTLKSILPELQKARKFGYAVPLYDVFDQFGVDGVFDAQEITKAPVIIGIYSGASIMKDIAAFVAYIRAKAERTCYPVSVMLDHGTSVEQCLFAIESGFTDVMFDGSSLSFEDNIRETYRIVEAAHTCGAGVEAELGHVGSGSKYESYGGQRIGFTDPNLVEEFVSSTNVDILAIAFGNAHGQYSSKPEIDLELLSDVYKRVDIPLVMHGGSGLQDSEYREVIRSGVSKINIFTTIHNAAVLRMIDESKTAKPSMFSITGQIREAYRDICAHYFDVFGATNKGI